VNGEVASLETSDMVHSCATIISYASTLMTLLPATSSIPALRGVIAAIQGEAGVLKAGDRLTTTIEKLGTLRLPHLIF